MSDKNNDNEGGGRFSDLLSGGLSGSKEIWDCPILELDDVVVAPSLGSIVPNWLIIVPRAFYFNFRDWSAENVISPYAMLENVASQLGIASDRFIWFEHGANQIGSKTSCGMERAHLHFIIDPVFSFEEFKKQTMNRLPIDWKSVNPLTCYDEIDDDTEYLIFGTKEKAFIITDEKFDREQFFRHVVAELTDQSDKWNYRDYEFTDNINETVSNLARINNKDKNVRT